MSKLKSYFKKLKKWFITKALYLNLKKILKTSSFANFKRFFKVSFKKLSWVKKIALAGGILMGILVFYLLINFFSISPAEQALASLKSSWEQEIICHETCSLARQEKENLIVQVLKNSLAQTSYPQTLNSSLARQLQNYFKTGNKDPNFQKELIKIWVLAFGPEKMPNYISNYLASSQVDSSVQAVIIKSFSPSLFSSEKSANPLAYYFKLLASEKALAIKKTAILAISSDANKKLDFNLPQLAFIEKMISNPLTKEKLREPLVLLLSDYYPLFPQKTTEILSKLYHNQVESEAISRLFAADILNRKGEKNLVLPVVSSASWQAYYHN